MKYFIIVKDEVKNAELKGLAIALSLLSITFYIGVNIDKMLW